MSRTSIRNACLITLIATRCVVLAEETSVPLMPVVPTNNSSMAIVSTLASRGSDQALRNLASYQADASGRWDQPAVERAGETEFIPLTLRTTAGVIRIELSVLLDGRTPQQYVDHQLDQVILNASKMEKAEAKNESVDTESKNAYNEGIAAESTDSVTVGGTEVEAPDEVEEVTVTARPYTRDGVLAKLERLVRATGTDDVDREELRWMLNQWRPGPIWLISRDSVSPPGRLIDPLLSWLDMDRDGKLASDEWEGVLKRLNRLDSNRDHIIQLVELNDATMRDRRPTIRLAPRSSWNLAFESGDTEGPPNDNLSNQEDVLLATIQTTVHVRSPGLANQVADQVTSMLDAWLDTKLNETLHSCLTLKSDAGDVKAGAVGVLAIIKNSEHPINLRVHGYFDERASDVSKCQFSIAARLNDRALWAVVDRNGDGRLVELEQRSAARRLAELDGNEDGVLSPDEWPQLFDMIVCQGSEAANLIQSTVVTPLVKPDEANVPIPDWFSGMDSNQDGSLSRGEFLGSTEQFLEYDSDGDGLVTPAEIAAPAETDKKRQP